MRSREGNVYFMCRKVAFDLRNLISFRMLSIPLSSGAFENRTFALFAKILDCTFKHYITTQEDSLITTLAFLNILIKPFLQIYISTCFSLGANSLSADFISEGEITSPHKKLGHIFPHLTGYLAKRYHMSRP